jgi:hypothetical protein
MILRSKLLLLLLTVGKLVVFSQTPVISAFQAGEVLRFKGSYYMSSLWADLAEIKSEVTDYNAEGKALYYIKATASTFSNYDSFFKIRDLYQSWIDKNDVKPYIFKRSVDEGGYKFNMKYIIKRSSLQAKYELERKGEISTSEINIKENTQDLVSVLYYIRTFDFEKMAINKSVTISILVDDKVENMTLTYRGKETLKTEVFGSISCFKLGISAENKALVNKETNNIWLTANGNKIPVQAEAVIPVGSIKLKLVEAKGIKNQK